MQVNKLYRCRQQGFSLVEIVTACGLAGIMFTAGMAGFSSGFQGIKLDREQSRATQIRVMNCGQVPFVNVPNTETPCRQQLSVATGVPNSHGEPHSTVRSDGQNVNTGGVVSWTVIV